MSSGFDFAKFTKTTAVQVDKIDVGLGEPICISHVFHPNPPKEYEARIDVGGGVRINLERGTIEQK
ncbi:hypothetical protein FJ251_13295 [bacterium]|nr:hypothetical protein [bacterium]